MYRDNINSLYHTITGTIEGFGTVRSAHFQRGSHRALWKPGGDEIGVLRADNQLLLAPESTVEVQIGGTAAGVSHDQFNIYNVVDYQNSDVLDGTLRVVRLPGYALQEGDRFTVVAADYWPDWVGTSFGRYEGLVDEASDFILWPVYAAGAETNSGMLVLEARRGVPALSPVITLESASAERGERRVVEIYGSGFTPDVSVRLECATCNAPETHGTVQGYLYEIGASEIEVEFDLEPLDLYGGYTLVVENPRGGRAEHPFEVTAGQPVVYIVAEDSLAGEADQDAGVFTIRSNAPFDEEIAIPISISGTASYFLDYVTSHTGELLYLPAGEREVRLVVTPLGDALAEDTETVEVTINHAGVYALGEARSAELRISNSDAYAGLRVVAFSPRKGGEGGTAVIRVTGQGFDAASMVELVRGGDVVRGSSVVVNEGRTALTAVVDLAGQAPGLFDVVVSNSAGERVSFEQAFSVVPAEQAEVWVDLVGPETVRRGVLAPYYAIVHNRGNVDAFMVPVWITASFDSEDPFPPFRLGFQIDSVEGWEEAAPVTRTEDSLIVAVTIPVVPAGGRVVLPFRAEATRLAAWSTLPLASGFPAQANPEALRQLLAVAGFGDPLDGLTGCALGIGLAITDIGATLLQADCLAGAATFVSGLVAAGFSAQASTQAGDVAGYTLGTAGLLASTVNLILGCADVVFPPLQIISVATSIVTNVISTAYSCYQVIPEDEDKTPEPTPEDPFEWPEETEDIDVLVISSFDPNDKLGPAGAGPDRYVSAMDPYFYLIRFENKSEATAPALEVLITDQLDPSVYDLSTFELGPITIGDSVITPPSGLQSFSTDVTLPERNLRVSIVAHLDAGSGYTFWRFSGLDLSTGEPPDDPFAGFLPPNQNPPEGEGSVAFTVRPRTGLGTGTEVLNQARIFFDVNEPIDTPPWTNVIDADLPSSRVLPLPDTQGGREFVVRWQGDDAGSGVRTYSIYASRDGGPFEIWLSGTSDTLATFSADTSQTVAFYSIARDAIGQVEPMKSGPDAATSVSVEAETADDGLPKVFALHQNRPNPFGGATVIGYDVPRPSAVRIAVYDILGRQVALLVDGHQLPGRHVLTWRADGLGSGIYFCRMKADGFSGTRRLVLLR